MELLLASGADVGLKSACGSTPEDEADDEEVVQLLQLAADAAAAGAQ